MLLSLQPPRLSVSLTSPRVYRACGAKYDGIWHITRLCSRQHSAVMRKRCSQRDVPMQVSALGHSAGAHMWAMVLLERARATRRSARQRTSHVGQADRRMPVRFIGGCTQTSPDLICMLLISRRVTFGAAMSTPHCHPGHIA